MENLIKNQKQHLNFTCFGGIVFKCDFNIFINNKRTGKETKK